MCSTEGRPCLTHLTAFCDGLTDIRQMDVIYLELCKAFTWTLTTSCPLNCRGVRWEDGLFDGSRWAVSRGLRSAPPAQGHRTVGTGSQRLSTSPGKEG